MSKKTIAVLLGGILLVIIIFLAVSFFRKSPVRITNKNQPRTTPLPKLPPNVQTVEQVLLKYDSYASPDEQKLILDWMNQGLHPSATSSAMLALIKKVAVTGDTVKINTKCEPSPVVLQLTSSKKVKVDNTSQSSKQHIFSLGSDHYRLEEGKIIEASVSATLNSTLIPINCDNPGGIIKGFVYLP